MKEKIKIALVGAGWMAGMCIDGKEDLQAIEPVAVYSRRLEQAREFSEKYNLGTFTNNYNDLLCSPEIDAFYIATTNESHYELAQQAIDAGKHVLIEKPLTLNHTEAKLLADNARSKRILLMEAMWSRFIPSMMAIKALIDAGKIGNIKSIKVQTGCILTPEKNSRVYNLDLGGGALVDIGVYPISILQMLTENVPVKIESDLQIDETYHVDLVDNLKFTYSNGASAEIIVDITQDLPATLWIEGTRGSIQTDNCVYPQGFTFSNKNDNFYYDYSTNVYRYNYQLEHFARCILEGRSESYIMPVQDSLQVMQIMDRCRHKAGYYFPQESAFNGKHR